TTGGVEQFRGVGWSDGVDEGAGAELVAGNHGDAREDLDVPVSAWLVRKRDERPIERVADAAHRTHRRLKQRRKLARFVEIVLVRLRNDPLLVREPGTTRCDPAVVLRLSDQWVIVEVAERTTLPARERLAFARGTQRDE